MTRNDELLGYWKIKAARAKFRSSRWRWWRASVKVWRAFLTKNCYGKSEDVNGRTYRYVHRIFGHEVMVEDYLHGNSWCVK